MLDLHSLASGALAGGITALAVPLAKRYLDIRLGEWHEARQKLRHYAKPLWLACRGLEAHMRHVVAQHEGEPEHSGLATLRFIPREHAKSIDWYVKDGHYITISAYLLASVACWIRLYEHDVVFLRFRRRSSSARFSVLIHQLRKAVTEQPSLLWTQYLDGVGEVLVADAGSGPMKVSDFVRKLHVDEDFSGYCDQLFRYVASLAETENRDRLKRILASTEAIREFLEGQIDVP